MTRYYRVSLGRDGVYAEQARVQGWVGTGWMADRDLTGQFPAEWKDFNKKHIPFVIESGEVPTKVGAGLACGMTWTVCRGLAVGDYVLSRTADKAYFQVGRVSGDYFYAAGQPLPHRRPVQWLDKLISRADLGEEISHRIAAGAVQDFTGFEDILRPLIEGDGKPVVSVSSQEVENPFAFVMEKYLEEFLVDNWKHTELGKNFDIFEVDGELVGQQYMSDTGPIDILAISKDKKTLLVVELKRGKVSDNVVGQIQRYMGYVKEELLEPGQQVRGVIIGLDDDKRIQRALSVATGIDFYKYEVNFKLHKG